MPRWEHKTKPIDWLIGHVLYDGDDCLAWPYGKDGKGRGSIYLDGRNLIAPREMCRRAYGEPPTRKHHAAHSCGKGHEGCINPKHLSWKTPLENRHDMVRHGTLLQGQDHPGARLTEAQIKEIRSLKGKTGPTELAKRFGVLKGSIANIFSGKSWAWLE